MTGTIRFSRSPELEKGLKKRVKLHNHENGENGQIGANVQNGQNGEIDSDDNYIEVTFVNIHHTRIKAKIRGSHQLFVSAGHNVSAAGGEWL